MGKAYWIAFYHEISDPKKLAAYAKLAGRLSKAAAGVFWRGEHLPRCMTRAEWNEPW